MKCRWLRRTGAQDSVRVIALGWGQDEASLDRWLPDGGDEDVLSLFAWSDPGAPPDLAGYRRRRLLAWSFGVWSAAWLPVEWDDAVAVNGTLTPVDDAGGIPPAHFAATLDGWCDGVTERKFWRRMGARPEDMPVRRSEELRRELEYFRIRFATEPAAPNCYRLAVVGAKDRIFPPEAQQHAWNSVGIRVVETDWPHDFRSVAGSLSEVDGFGHDR